MSKYFLQIPLLVLFACSVSSEKASKAEKSANGNEVATEVSAEEKPKSEQKDDLPEPTRPTVDSGWPTYTPHIKFGRAC